jgi:uncharacterized protein (DUF2461 family)
MEGTETRRFVVEVSVRTDAIAGRELRDELLDALTANDEYPDWVFSIDNVDDAR